MECVPTTGNPNMQQHWVRAIAERKIVSELQQPEKQAVWQGGQGCRRKPETEPAMVRQSLVEGRCPSETPCTPPPL